ncbi:hypothetical protein [Blattabacterium cuenoti]|uniref:hypothetical protein n=1 Tax=Blattabacterium cuenoti TaxID=1653831 RepID=UPI00163C37C9|nr:hypothetical protein [Blattabacterium cuenoti]
MNNLFYKNVITLIEKYKPKNFNEIIGQEEVILLLKKITKKNKLSNTLVFIGPKGVGKNICAHLLSNELNYFFSSNVSYNIFEIHDFLNYTLDNILKLISHAKHIPKIGKYYVIIFNNTKLTCKQYFFHLFLKLIHKKYSHILFIFCYTKKNKIPENILSISQVYEFKKISIEKIYLHLKMISSKEKINVVNDALYLISEYVNGSISKAIYIFNNILLGYDNKENYIITKELIMEKLGIISVEYYLKIVDFFLKKNFSEIFLLLNKVFSKNINYFKFIIGLIKHFKFLFLYKNSENISSLRINKEIIKCYVEQSKKISNSVFNEVICLLHNYYLKRKYILKKNPILIIEMCIIQLAHIFLNCKNEKDKNSLEENKNFFFRKDMEKFY